MDVYEGTSNLKICKLMMTGGTPVLDSFRKRPYRQSQLHHVDILKYDGGGGR